MTETARQVLESLAREGTIRLRRSSPALRVDDADAAEGASSGPARSTARRVRTLYGPVRSERAAATAPED